MSFEKKEWVCFKTKNAENKDCFCLNDISQIYCNSDGYNSLRIAGKMMRVNYSTCKIIHEFLVNKQDISQIPREWEKF